MKGLIAAAPMISFGLSGTRKYQSELMRKFDISKETPLFKPDKNSPDKDKARYMRYDFGFKIKAGVLVADKYEAMVGCRNSVNSIRNDDFELHYGDNIDGDTMFNLFFTLGYKW